MDGIKAMQFDGNAAKVMDELLSGLTKPKVKKPPKKIATLSPIQMERFRFLSEETKKLKVELARMISQNKSQFSRFWLDIKDAYQTHGVECIHIHNGVLYEGGYDETDHRDVDPMISED